MHYLRWDINRSPAYLAGLGVSQDASLGYADQVGFRCGTSYEFPAFDPLNMHADDVKKKIEETKNEATNFVGKVKYSTIEVWQEHRTPKITDLQFVLELFRFMEEPLKNYSCCLIATKVNKCRAIVMAVIYLMLKFKWCLRRCLEFMNSKKSDIEITKQILSDLKVLEAKIQRALSKKDATMRQNWEVTFQYDIHHK